MPSSTCVGCPIQGYTVSIQVRVFNGVTNEIQYRVATQYCAEPKTAYSVINGVQVVTGTVCTIPLSNLEGNEFNLNDGDSVNARIVAMNCIGGSATSSVNNGAIIPSVPSAPTAGTCGARTINSVTFTWSASANDGGAAVSEYRVTAQPVGNSQPNQIITQNINSVTNNVDFTNRRYTLTGLTNGVTYQITVASRNVAGYSAESVAFNCIACVNPPQPTGLTNVQNGNTANSLRLSWSAGVDN